MAAEGSKAEYVNVAAVATRLSVHDQTVRKLLADGELPYTRVAGRVRIAWADVDAYVARHRAGGTANGAANGAAKVPAKRGPGRPRKVSAA
jgi:excisionase family DNA binding protein